MATTCTCSRRDYRHIYRPDGADDDRCEVMLQESDEPKHDHGPGVWIYSCLACQAGVEHPEPYEEVNFGPGPMPFAGEASVVETKATASDPNGDVQHHVNPVLGWLRLHVHRATDADPLTAEQGSLKGQAIEMDAELLAAMARHLKAALDAIDR